MEFRVAYTAVCFLNAFPSKRKLHLCMSLLVLSNSVEHFFALFPLPLLLRPSAEAREAPQRVCEAHASCALPRASRAVEIL